MTAVPVHYRIDCAPSLPADAPTMVMAGSLGSTLEMWDAQAAVLARSARIVRFDIRGHGRTPMAGTTVGISDLADDLLALLDRLDLGRVHLAGLSLGGMVSMSLASRRPDRVESLSVVCTSAYLPPARGWLDRAASVRAGGTGAVADAVVARWFTPDFQWNRPEVVVRYRDMIASISPAGYAACCEAIAAMDLRADLASITAPTLVIAGSEDPATPPDHQRAIASAISGARLEILGPAAHLANVEQAEAVSSLLADQMGVPVGHPHGELQVEEGR
ncbi:3-oxoadipate enol-lactonase [Nakamurella sp. UYEF19]|uniref:3-oxoadipate enol-lactonase n=1 Tax=Nakamurella sp. UYEF19 TaxID=1756392 RepID=UPI0033922F71